MLMDSILGKTTLPVVLKSLDAQMLKNRVISNNIANVTTPGFKRVDVSFEDQLRSALDRTALKGSTDQVGHLELGRSRLDSVEATAFHPIDPSQPSGVNNVDIDTEMAKLAENQISFNYGIKFANNVFKKLNAAVAGKSIQ